MSNCHYPPRSGRSRLVAAFDPLGGSVPDDATAPAGCISAGGRPRGVGGWRAQSRTTVPRRLRRSPATGVPGHRASTAASPRVRLAWAFRSAAGSPVGRLPRSGAGTLPGRPRGWAARGGHARLVPKPPPRTGPHVGSRGQVAGPPRRSSRATSSARTTDAGTTSPARAAACPALTLSRFPGPAMNAAVSSSSDSSAR